MIETGLDLNCLSAKKITGIGVYAMELIKQLSVHPSLACRGYVKASRLKHFSRIKARCPLPLRIYTPLDDWGLTGLDLFHGLDFRIPSTTKFKKVVTVHDLIVFEKKFNTPANAEEGIRNFTHMIRQCKPDHVITVSEFSRQKLIQYMPDYAEKSTAIHLGADHRKTSAQESANLYGNYIFYIGTLEKRKNLTNIIQAFELLKATQKDLKLILAGGLGFEGNEILQQIQQSPATKDIIYLSFVDDAIVQSLFQHAQAFVFPSFYEGFGIPVLEAMQWGCPVVTSNDGALAEIVETAAVTVSPLSPAEIAEGLRNVLENPNLRQQLIAAGHEQAKKYTWKKCAEETVAVYRQVLSL